MKKTILLIALIVAAPITAHSACVADGANWDSTPDEASVTSCISQADAGDTINVSAGSGTWSAITIAKGINLIGAGIGNTIIESDGTLSYRPSNYDLNTPFRLSGFSFNMNSRAGTVLALGISDKQSPFTVQTNVRIDNNRFYGKTGTAPYIWDYLNCYGVVDHNIFDGPYFHFRHHAGDDGRYGWWTTSPQNNWYPGTITGLYIENNTFNITDSSGWQLADTYSAGGKYIYRYNLITAPGGGDALLDMHGNQNSMGDGSFGGEVYGNRITLNSGSMMVYKDRGGSSFVYMNSVSSGSSNQVYAGTIVGCPTEAYNGAEQLVHDTYFWSNRTGYTGTIQGASGNGTYFTCLGLSDRPLEGRDFFDDTSTPGVTMGTLANRPSTCTTGQGYWATNQSTTDLTGMVGVDPSTPISGTFYKCTATDTWTSFYTPYTYPNPLTDVTAPTRSAGYPSGMFNAGTTSTTIGLTTDENATCRYGSVAAVAYADIPNTFTTTGTTSHSSSITGLSNGTTYTYYIRCRDGNLNVNTNDYTISFSVAAGTPSSQADFILHIIKP